MNNCKAKAPVSQRNYGIDLLRLVAAFYVVVIHVINQGGIFPALKPDSHQYFLCRLMMIFAMCAVNIFGVVSGYVGYRDTEKKATVFGYLPIWSTAVFYGVSICGIYMFLMPGTVTVHDLVPLFFPLTQGRYWYFCAYTLVYFLAPYLNRILQQSSEKELRKLFWIICLVIVPLEYHGRTFQMGFGYSSIWLMFLYLIGGMIKKCRIGKKIPAVVLILGILANNIFYLWLNTRIHNIAFFVFEFWFEIDSSYISPFYLAPAIFYVMLFSRFSFPAPIRKIIAFSAPATLAVFIANVQPQFWQYYMHQRFAPWAHSSPAGLLVRIAAFSFGFVALVSIIDHFRRILSRALGIPTLLQRISRSLQTN